MIEAGALDRVVRETIQAIESAKDQIFAIAEDARIECSRVKDEISAVREVARQIIDQVDEMTLQEKRARIRLVEVSRDLDRYGEEDIRQAYEAARDYQIQLAVLREREAQLKGKRDELEHRLRHLQGMVIRAERLMSQVGVVLDFIGGNLKDISLHYAEQKRHPLGVRLIFAMEEERRRVAREIHDGPAQLMANIVLQAELCDKLLDMNPERVRQELRELKVLVRGTLMDVRKIIYDLRPVAVDELGLWPALRKYIADFEERYGIEVDARFLGEEKRLASAIEVAVFRMVQEGLSNVRKHAQAQLVQVCCETAPQGVNVIIRDNGCGFDPEAVSAREDHLGLLGMRERAEILDGSVDIRSRHGEGTRITIKIPLPATKNRGEEGGETH
ncbi:MAG: sensor histidine kinase [Heliobacteriaceae bacterium]|nr:sensor histidine kinase [Heliobacteriaceae bacterium]MDD4588294.1 sensor histidine kinase [Heliobacteriaceae bacterium]